MSLFPLPPRPPPEELLQELAQHYDVHRTVVLHGMHGEDNLKGKVTKSIVHLDCLCSPST